MKIKLKVWRQEDSKAQGRFETYEVPNVSPDMTFLELLDTLNLDLVRAKKRAIEFEHDCREGICGSCSLTINGLAHGPMKGTATCQLHMRKFKDGDTICVEPWRANAFPVIKDLVVDRSAFDRIISQGGFISVNTGSAKEANAILIPKHVAEKAFDAASCIGCGACVQACKNSSAMLFVSAKVMHFAYLPQGQPEREERAKKMVQQMETEGFGSCSNTGACEAACPKSISLTHIAELNREVRKSLFQKFKI